MAMSPKTYLINKDGIYNLLHLHKSFKYFVTWAVLSGLEGIEDGVNTQKVNLQILEVPDTPYPW